MNQKPLDEQVIVITGASSGIGRATAEMAAAQGAHVVLAARSEDALQEIVDSIRAKGGSASFVVADVSKQEDVQRIAEEAKRQYGSFDTWVNNAGVSIYGRLEQVKPEDHKQLFETNFWGTVNGSLVAVEHLRTYGGTLINIGSTLSERAIPLQGMYSASKHAVKGFTDALRMELEYDDAPVQVTLIKPAAMDTNYPKHAKNYMDKEATLPEPIYHPNLVAEAILHCATHEQRDMFVGGAGGKGIAAMGNNAPRLTDKYMETTMFDQQKGNMPAHFDKNGLYTATGGGSVRGYNRPGVRKTSLYTQAQTRPAVTGTVATALIGVGAGLLAWRLISNRDDEKGESWHSDPALPPVREGRVGSGVRTSEDANFSSEDSL